MKIFECIELLSNVNETKRIANAYIEDCRRLNLEELKAGLVKTAEQYASALNISKQIKRMNLHTNPVIRIVAPIIMRDYLINVDEFLSPCKVTEDAVVSYEQSIIDASNNFDYKNLSRDFTIFKFLLDTAWAHGSDISVDEKNLIEATRKYLNITVDEQNMLEAKAGRFPMTGNVIHTRSEIDMARKELQSAGILFYIKNADGVPCDVIPEEIVAGIRQYYGIEMKKYGYKRLIEYITKITKKQYLIDIIQKHNDNPETSVIDMPQNPTVAQLQEILLKAITPSNLIGGFSPRDGLDAAVLSKWCSDLGIPAHGVKPELIKRLINYYDELREIELSTEDEREKYYLVYHELSARDLSYLRKNNIIDKDLQCEHYFEKATDYLFEIKLKNKPLALVGTEHPDGKLSYRDKYVMWDNKSKETPVNLKDHILQFDNYIKNSDKPVSVFLVIGPSFTENSISECVKYSLNNETQILLITADELKEIAELWEKTYPTESFNLGYFKQNGRFDKSLIAF